MDSEFCPTKLLGFPDYHKDPANWNKYWESLIEVTGSLDLLQYQTGAMPDMDEQGLLSSHRNRLQRFCYFQRIMTFEVLCHRWLWIGMDPIRRSLSRKTSPGGHGAYMRYRYGRWSYRKPMVEAFWPSWSISCSMMLLPFLTNRSSFPVLAGIAWRERIEKIRPM